MARLNHLNLRVRDPQACRASYERHFGFQHVFDADGGPSPDETAELREALERAGVRVGALEDLRPDEDHVSFRS